MPINAPSSKPCCDNRRGQARPLPCQNKQNARSCQNTTASPGYRSQFNGAVSAGIRQNRPRRQDKHEPEHVEQRTGPNQALTAPKTGHGLPARQRKQPNDGQRAQGARHNPTCESAEKLRRHHSARKVEMVLIVQTKEDEFSRNQTACQQQNKGCASPLGHRWT